MEESTTGLGELAKALAQFQGAVGSVPKTQTARIRSKRTGETFEFAYADLADILAVVHQPLAEAGLSHFDLIEPHSSGGHLVTTQLVHTSGQWISSSIRIPPTGEDPKAFGAWLQYARRYTLIGILGIAAGNEEPGDDRPDSRPPQKPERKVPRSLPPAPTPPPAGDTEERFAGIEAAAERAGILIGDIERWAVAFFRCSHLAELSAGQCRRVERAAVEGEIADWLVKHGGDGSEEKATN